MTTPLVSVIIPAYQAAENIEACVASVLRQEVEGNVETIVVDNASTDDTRERVARLPVTLVTEPRRGRSAARNHGARLARGAYLGFIDADCEAPADWLRRSIGELKRPWVGAAQARVQKFGYPPPSPEFTQAYYYRPFLDTCALVTTRVAYEHAQGYDEELRRNVDMDFSFRLLACGYAFSWLPSLLMIKHHDLTPRQIFRRGWDGGVSVVVLARKWPQFSEPSALRAWRDRGLAFARAVTRDFKQPSRSGGRESLEATVKLLAAAYTELRGQPIQRPTFEPQTMLARLLGAQRSLVLLENGALLFDARQRSIHRFDANETSALCELVDTPDPLETSIAGAPAASSRATFERVRLALKGKIV